MNNIIIENIMAKIKNNEEKIVFDLVLTRNQKYLIFLDEVFERGGKNLGSIWDNTYIFKELIGDNVNLLNEEEQYIVNNYTFTKSSFIHYLKQDVLNETILVDKMVNYVMKNVISGLRWLRRNAYTNIGMVVDIVASFISLKGNAVVWGLLVLLGIYEIATNDFDPKDPDRKENPYLSLIFDSIALVFTAGPALLAKKAIQGGVKTLSKSPKTINMLTEIFKKFPSIKNVLTKVGNALGKKLNNKTIVTKMLSFIDNVLFKILSYFKKLFSLKTLKVAAGAAVTVTAFNGLFMALEAAIKHFGGGSSSEGITDNTTPKNNNDNIIDINYLDSIIGEHTILNEQNYKAKLINYLINKGGKQVVVKVSANIKSEFITNLKKAINEVSKNKAITNIKNASSELKNNPNFKTALGRLVEDVSQNTFNKSYKNLTPAEKNLISDNVNKIIKQESDNILSKAISGRTTNLINKGKGAQVNIDDVLARLNKLQSGARAITKTEANEIVKIIQGLPPLVTAAAPKNKNFFVRIGGQIKQYSIDTWRKLYPKIKNMRILKLPRKAWEKLKSMRIWKSGVTIAGAAMAVYFLIFGTDSQPTVPVAVDIIDNAPAEVKPIFNKCIDFPFEPGCVNDKIGEIRDKLNLAKNNAYDRILHEHLISLGYDMRLGITEEIYNKIMSGKNKVVDVDDNFIDDKTPSDDFPTPTPLPADNPEETPSGLVPSDPNAGDSERPKENAPEPIQPNDNNKRKIRKVKYNKDGSIKKERFYR